MNSFYLNCEYNCEDVPGASCVSATDPTDSTTAPPTDLPTKDPTESSTQPPSDPTTDVTSESSTATTSVSITESEGTMDCSFSYNCDTVANDAWIICSKPTPSLYCECQKNKTSSGGAFCEDLTLTGVTATTMDADKCRSLCQDVPACFFWKYNDHNKWQKFCHLMNEGQCRTADDNLCDGKNCTSGNLGGETGKPACNAGTDNGPPTCPGPIVTHPDDGSKFQKWKCSIQTNSRVIQIVDMYAADAEMPLGGFCELKVLDDGGR